MRQSAAAGSSRLLRVFWDAPQVELGRGAPGAGILRIEPEAASGSERTRRQAGAGVEPAAELAAERRLPDVEGSGQAHPVPAGAGRRGTGRAIEKRLRESTRRGRGEKTDRASRPAGGSV